MADSEHDDTDGIARLREIMRRLRNPEGGCPWDVAQDFRSIAPYTIEEAYEVADAIERDDMGDLADELGDLLLQVVYHAQMAEESGAFAFEDVTRAICDKMVRRHPHVFGHGPDGRDAAAQTTAWEAIKAVERAGKGRRASALDGVAAGLPGLTRAAKLQSRAARAGFAWRESEPLIAKIVEEAQELAAEQDGDHARVEDEFGDLLFVVVALGRRLGVDPDAAIRGANAKFERRFRAMEDRLAAEGREPEEASLAELEAMWTAAKAAER